MSLSKIEILGSSSSGCAYVLYFDNGKVYQLDAGVKNPKKELVNKLFISHDHPDHIKYAKDYQNVIYQYDGDRSEGPTDYWESFLIPHRTLNNGYIFKEDDSTIGYITDCGDFEGIKNLNLSHLDYLFIEANWDPLAISQKRLFAAEHAKYSFSKVGHMSTIDCLRAIIKWKVSKDCKIIFIHKSSQHTIYPDSFKLFDILPNQWHVAKAGDIIYCKSWKVV